MLVASIPQIEQPSIECNKIKAFKNYQEAKAYAASKNGYDVYREQGQEKWYVIPKVTEMMTGGCYDNESS